MLAPVFVQVGLTFVLLFMLGPSRAAAVRRGEVRVEDIALGQPAWPAGIIQIANCFRNQLELPVLFYLLIMLAIVTAKADVVVFWLSVGFAASRIVHAYVHVTSNHVPSRFHAYLVGLLLLIAMWFWFAYRLYLQGGSL